MMYMILISEGEELGVSLYYVIKMYSSALPLEAQVSYCLPKLREPPFTHEPRTETWDHSQLIPFSPFSLKD